MILNVYQSETDSFLKMKSIGRVRFLGQSFYKGDGLTDNSIYDVIEVDDPDLIRVVDDSKEDYLYPIKGPCALDGSTPPGRWELVEDYSGILSEYIS